MKLKKIIFLCLLLFMGGGTAISAQEIEKSTKTELIGNKTYYMHTVRTGQTIYAIAKAYSVDLTELQNANPEVKNNIQPGVILKVPQVKNPELITGLNHKVEKGETLYKIATNYNLKVPEIVAVNPGLTDNIKPGQVLLIPLTPKKLPETPPLATTIHIVQKGETLFSIATQYAITVDELKKLNPGLTENLQLGHQLKVPLLKKVETPVKKDSVVVFDCGKTGRNDSYNIAVMIPFYLDHSYNIDTGDLKTPSSSYKSLTFIQFYEGILMAVDSLEKTGLSAKIYIYDVAEDTSATASILKKPEFKEMNLIIGPLFSNNFSIVAKWAQTHKISIINPFTNKSDLITDNAWAYKLIPSQQDEARQIISFIGANYPASNVIIVTNDKEQVFADSLKTIFDVWESTNNKKLQINKIAYAAEGFAGISKLLSENSLNIVINLIDGEAFASTFLRNLNVKAFDNKILLFGRKSWEDYNNLEIEYLLNLNTHLYSNSFINYSDNRIQDMVLNFRNRYNTDPDYYAFQGYDIMMYFANALKTYGKGFPGCLHLYHPMLLCNNFHFNHTSSRGFENTTGIIYRFENYKTINALQNPVKDIQLVVKKKPE